MAYPPTVIPFPVKGVDQSQPFANQGDLTCPGALNVRSFAVSTGRNHGGRRAGTRRLFNQQAGSGSDRRINHIDVVARTVILAASTAGTNVPITDDLIYPHYAVPSTHSGDVLSNYIFFRKVDTSAWVLLGVELAYRAYFTQSPNHPLGFLEFYNNGTAAEGHIGMAVAYPTTNDVGIQLLNDNVVSAAVAGNYHPDGIGPFIRGSADLKQKVTAYLEWTGQANTVRLVIDQLTETTRVRLKSSAKEFVLDGRANPETGTLNDPPCQIRLSSTSTSITASVYYPTGAPGGVVDTITYEHASGAYYATNNRGGVMVQSNAVAALRAIRRLECTRVEPYAWPITTDMRAALISPGANRYQVPSGITASVSAAIATAPTQTPGPSTSAALTTVAIDTTTKTLVGSAGANVAIQTNIFAVNTAPAGSAFAIDLFYNNLSAGTDQLNPVFKLSSDHKYMIRVRLTRVISAFSLYYSQTAYTEVLIEAFYNNAGTRARITLATFTIDNSNTNGAPIWYYSSGVRWQCVGTTISCSINGMQVFSYDYSLSGSYAGNVLPAITPYGDLAGVDLGSAGAAPVSPGFRIVNLSPITSPTVAAGTDIVLYSANQVDIGNPDAPTSGLTANVGPIPSGTAIESAVLNGKIYTADGTNVLELDPIAKTSRILIADAGNYPIAPTLAAVYRGRLVLAAPANNRTFCAMSAVGKPANWDYGSLVAATKAVALTFADVGAPPDAITCLIPFSDDYMIFGCVGSLWLLVGDPGAGGSVQNISYQTGILGSKAFCFTDTGALFFLGAGGLYMMNSGREYAAIGPRRVGALLDRIDTSTINPQLIFDPVTQCVHIFLTPRDGTTLGRHVVYHPPLDAFWIDELPLRFGPHAVAPLKGATAALRRYVMGGVDGYVRLPDDDSNDDDGTPIDSWVQFPPIEIAEGHRDSMAKDMRASGLRGSAPVQWSWRVDDSPEQVAQQGLEVYRETGTWFADGNDGYQGAVSVRETGAAHQLQIRQNIPAGQTQGTWGLERVQVQMADMGGRNE